MKIDHYSCIKDDKLVDGIKEKWCEETIRKYIAEYIKINNIKAIFTFDRKGISKHPNHQSLYFALKYW
jgi:N-acetylglucosaminylphosphatidylinositol deacetylase